MDIAIRALAISLEVVVLAALAYCFLNAVRLIAYDFGVKRAPFNQVIVVVLIALGGVLVTFFITHLITLYPRI